MTKEEYERLLKSDYWKGYSYSLIKERDFTCEDCGRRFYNERNKLQVHHLVYCDVNPWSYNPDEVVVLCEECHKKRHGLAFESEHPTSYTQMPSGEYDKEYTNSTDKVNESVFTSRYSNRTESNPSDYPIEPEQRSGFKFKYVLYGVLLFICIMIGQGLFNNQNPLNSNRPSYENYSHSNDKITSEISAEPKEAATEKKKPSKEVKVPATTEMAISEETAVPDAPVRSTAMDTEQEVTDDGNSIEVERKPSRELTTLEILEKRNHEDAVRRAKRAGVSTEGSTIEILERINHADVVKRAQRAGVSTEGSTIEILERINHADVVKRAQRAGVSTEGSTIDILERINHADVVKRAKRLGVSTEGTTIEILERINRKEMEKYNY